MTASSRRSKSTGEPSGTPRTSMPRSAGAGTVRVVSRWDPGRRPSSRVSSTSGALGSRCGMFTSPCPGTTNLWKFTQAAGLSAKRRIVAPSRWAIPRLTALTAPCRGVARRGAGQPLADESRAQTGDVTAEGGDLLDQAGGEERPLRGGRHEDRLDLGERGVHLRHLQLVVEVADRAEALHDRDDVALLAERGQQAAEGVDRDVGEALARLA